MKQERSFEHIKLIVRAFVSPTASQSLLSLNDL